MSLELLLLIFLKMVCSTLGVGGGCCATLRGGLGDPEWKRQPQRNNAPELPVAFVCLSLFTYSQPWIPSVLPCSIVKSGIIAPHYSAG